MLDLLGGLRLALRFGFPVGFGPVRANRTIRPEEPFDMFRGCVCVLMVCCNQSGGKFIVRRNRGVCYESNSD